MTEQPYDKVAEIVSDEILERVKELKSFARMYIQNILDNTPNQDLKDTIVARVSYSLLVRPEHSELQKTTDDIIDRLCEYASPALVEQIRHDQKQLGKSFTKTTKAHTLG